MLKHRNLEELYRKTERTIVTAHRGFSGRYPENTLTAMREAIRAGADIIEFDLRPTADGIPVLLHDPTLDRTSNAHGCPEDYTLKELKKFNPELAERPMIVVGNKADLATDEQIDQLGNQIKNINGVNKVTFVSKQDALNSMKAVLEDNQSILEGWDEENPFPASYFVTLTDLSLNEEVQEQIFKLDYVDEIESQNNTISKLQSLANGIQIMTIIILVLLIVISIFIISYTIKLTVHARRREISIMKYVGATNGFIRGPFIVEGVIIGIISAVITLVVLGLCYNAVMGGIGESVLVQDIGIGLLSFSDMFFLVLTVYLLLGIGIGILGSVISMRKYLKV